MLHERNRQQKILISHKMYKMATLAAGSCTAAAGHGKGKDARASARAPIKQRMSPGHPPGPPLKKKSSLRRQAPERSYHKSYRALAIAPPAFGTEPARQTLRGTGTEAARGKPCAWYWPAGHRAAGLWHGTCAANSARQTLRGTGTEAARGKPCAWYWPVGHRVGPPPTAPLRFLSWRRFLLRCIRGR